MRTSILIICLLALPLAGGFADGLMLPSDESYPADLLRNRVTEVTVNIRGLVAETVVYQEFLNEWDQATDAVYSFPLPEDARSTLLLYTRNDTTFRAVLKVSPQTPNPGTGGGGIAAQVNDYIGPHGIRLKLLNIAPGTVQKVELHYISTLDFHRGECTYRYPLASGDFSPYPLDHLEFNVNVNSARPITDFDIPSHPQYQTLVSEPEQLVLRMRQPLAFAATDILFRFTTDNQVLGIDFFSTNNDTIDGHFNLFVRPENLASGTELLTKNIVFLLGNSSSMIGYKLEQSIQAISQSLDMLGPDDNFNIILFNSSVYKWKPSLVSANAANIAAAKTYLSEVTGSQGSRLDWGIDVALNQFTNNQYNNVILAFTDGRSPIDPRSIALSNVHQTGLFFVAIGDDVERARLEMTADLNYGFVTYFQEDENLLEGMIRVSEKITMPLLKNVALTFDKPDVYGLIPQVYPSTYAGAYFFVAGRYQSPGAATLSLSGEGVGGAVQYDYQVDFNANTTIDQFAALLWAKEMIDALEYEVSVYGETPALKDSLIALSLRYGIRCRYTAYFADYTTVTTSIDPGELPVISRSFLEGNYPNPFNPSTTLRLYIDPAAAGKVKLIRIYNVLGQLVAIIDISRLQAGWHAVRFEGRDRYGNSLPSGIYFVQLQVGNQVINTIRVNLVK